MLVIAALTSLVARNRPPGSSLFTFEEKLRSPLLPGSIFGLLFFADAARRVAGTCPAGPPDLYCTKDAHGGARREGGRARALLR